MSGKSILVVAYDRIGPRMAGPSLRCLALAREIASTNPVIVLYDGVSNSIDFENVEFTSRDSVTNLPDFYSQFSSALAPPLVAMTNPELLESNLPLVIDLFDPVVWENLDLYSSLPVNEQEFQHERHLAALIAGCIRGDYFLVAGQRQVDLFTGALMALNRFNPAVCQPGIGPEQLIGLIPFGLDPLEMNSISSSDLPDEYHNDGPMVVWGGGIWDWLDPGVIIESWPAVLDKFPTAKLVFPGTTHPNPHVPEPSSLSKLKSAVSNLGIESSVIFGSWLERNQYLALLSEAACGTSAHVMGMESRYAVRTRFLDSINACLPLVVSGGDEYSPIIENYGLGTVIDSSNPEPFTRAFVSLMETGKQPYRKSFQNARNDLTWNKMAAPLLAWLENPVTTHGPGASFFSEAVGEPAPRNRPGDITSLMKRALGKLSGR